MIPSVEQADNMADAVSRPPSPAGTVRYDTRSVAPADGFAFWREAVCETYVRLGCDTPRRRDFCGSIAIDRLDKLSISRVMGMEQRVERRPRDIRADTDRSFLVSLQTEKTSRVTQFGRTAHLRPGDMALYDSAHPYTLEVAEGFSQTVVQIPAANLLARLPDARALVACRVDGQSPIGRLVQENVGAFAGLATEGDALLRGLVQDTLIDLIATGVAAQAGTLVALSAPERHCLLRVKTFVRDNFTAHELDRHAVAAAAGLSVRRLNAILAKEGTSVSSLIRECRLRAVAVDLREPRFKAMTVAELAYKNGFSNLQHFSTAFRKWSGRSPREYRKGGEPQA